MKQQFKHLLGSLGLSALFAVAMTPGIARAAPVCVDGNVCPGYDLFETQPGTTFGGFNFVGVPLNTYNFGGSIGTKATGTTDTIVQRLSNDTTAGGSTPLVINALQLESTTNYMSTGQRLFVSLGGDTQTNGTMTFPTLTAAGGTFNSSLPVTFEITLGSFTGTNETAAICGTDLAH